MYMLVCIVSFHQIDGLVQERRNSIANALELRLSYTNPSKWAQRAIAGIPDFVIWTHRKVVPQKSSPKEKWQH